MPQIVKETVCPLLAQTGKTLLVKAIAAEADASLHIVSPGEVVGAQPLLNVVAFALVTPRRQNLSTDTLVANVCRRLRWRERAAPQRGLCQSRRRRREGAPDDPLP